MAGIEKHRSDAKWVSYLPPPQGCCTNCRQHAFICMALLLLPAGAEFEL